MRGKMKVGMAVVFLWVCFLTFGSARAESKCKEGMMDKGMCMAGMEKSGKMGMEQKMDFEEMFYHKTGFFLMHSEDLGLTDDQKEKIQTLKMKVKKSMIMKEAEIDVAAIDIMDMLKADQTDMSAVNKLIDKKYGVKTQKAKELAVAYVEAKGILSKDQMKKAKDILGKDRMAGMGGCCGMECWEKCPMCAKMGGKCEMKGIGKGMEGMKHGSE